MSVKVFFSSYSEALPRANSLVIFCFEDTDFFGRAAALDLQSNKYLSSIISKADFTGKKEQSLAIYIPDKKFETCSDLSLVTFIGLGKEQNLNNLSWQSIGAYMYNKLKSSNFSDPVVLIETKNNQHIIASNIAYGAMLMSFKFTPYKTKQDDQKDVLKTICFMTEDEEVAKQYFQPMLNRASSILFARELSVMPPNDLYPKSYSKIVQDAFENVEGVKVEILTQKEMSKLGMNALLGVGRSSENEPLLIIINWNGSPNKNDPPIAFVGKGITFDSGGLCLKSFRNMIDMKYDMSGSAAVVGAMSSIAKNKYEINAVGVLALAENSISSTAQRPSDVVVSMSGQTIEILNTDAEGRLVLADAMWYTQEYKKPKYLIDIATLTGAVEVALGTHYAGLFSNDDDFSDSLKSIGKDTGELLWPLPLDDKYDKQINSDVADMQNVSMKGYGADAITAAQFLKRFVQKNVIWAHLDIAGVHSSKDDLDLCPKGPTGFGVSILDQFALKQSQEYSKTE